MTILLDIFGLLFLLLAARIAFCASLVHSILLLAISSVIICICYLLMDAPDVAMTEAALGACLSTVILLSITKYIPDNIGGASKSVWGVIICGIFAGIMLYVGTEFYSYGIPDTPIHSHLSKYFIDNTKTQIGIPSFVAAILASYRGYDTLGETAVILIAALGVYFIFTKTQDENLDHCYTIPLQTNLILKSVTKLILPYILFFALYIQLYGETSPGGGFQAGSIFASALIARSFFREVSNTQVYLVGAVTGVVIYASIGVLSMIMGGTFLDYSIFTTKPLMGQKIGIFAIEMGVGITVSSSMLLIYSMFTDGRPPPERTRVLDSEI